MFVCSSFYPVGFGGNFGGTCASQHFFTLKLNFSLNYFFYSLHPINFPSSVKKSYEILSYLNFQSKQCKSASSFLNRNFGLGVRITQQSVINYISELFSGPDRVDIFKEYSLCKHPNKIFCLKKEKDVCSSLFKC